MHVAGGHNVPVAGGRFRPLALAVLPAVFMSQIAVAASPDLYAATVVVTGRDNLAERARGIREALPLVLTKLTADDQIAKRALSQAIVENAEAAVERIEYVDRKEGVQISDEQGTRERSFELTVRFDPDKVDAIVEDLGGVVWAGERSRLAVALTIDDGMSTYLLTRSSEKGWGQRLAFEDAAQALALPIALPGEAPAADTAPRLEGNMRITAAGYWNTDWRFRSGDTDERFATNGVTFDAAIGEALRHSAKALAKH